MRVYESDFTEDDAQHAYKAVKSGILSSFGEYVSELETKFTNMIGRQHGLTCTNGTSALLLALIGLGITDKRVVIPACSFAATGFAAIAANNRLAFIDCDIKSWNIDVDKIRHACEYFDSIGDPVKAVIAVHNYGNPYDYNKLRKLSEEWNFKIIEDACEALMGKSSGLNVGQLGHVSVFSFYGNKLIASGEGGFVLTDDTKVYEAMKLYRGQGQDPTRKFWHLIAGFNYRMTNLQASVVVSQLNRIDQIQSRKLEIAKIYQSRLSPKFKFQETYDDSEHAWWMVSILGDNNFYERTSMMLCANNIETRPIFPPLPFMPAFGRNTIDYSNAEYANSINLYLNGITLPSGPKSTDEEIHKVCDLILGS